jgi:hypothetical protein
MRFPKINLFSFVLVVGVIILTSLLGGGLTWVAKQNHAAMRLSAYEHLESEVDLLSQIVESLLQAGDYQEVEDFLASWGENQEEILEIITISKQGFSLGSYKRSIASDSNLAESTLTASRKISYSYEGSATIYLIKDIQSRIREVNRTIWQMGVVGAVFLLLLLVVGLLAKRLHLDALLLRGERENLEGINDKLQLEMEKNSNMVLLQKKRLNLVDQISKERDAAKIADIILLFLADAADAQAGAFFIADEKGNLQTVATKGRPKGDAAQQQFLAGEGLPGQVVLSKFPIYVDNVPTDYQPIFSSIVTATPRAVLVFPFLYHDRVVCVVELACLGEFQDDFKEILHLVSDTVAIAILNALLSK